MTITHVCERPTAGAAHAGAYVVTVGRYADGRPARLTLGADGRGGGRSEHATIYGDTRSGVTSTLRTILAGGLAAGWDTTVIDPDVDGLKACNQILRDEYELARFRLDEPDAEQHMRMVVIDNLQTLVKRRNITHNLHRFAAIAGRAGIAMVVGTHDISLSGFGGRYLDSTIPRASMTQTLLTLRANEKPLQRAALRALGVDMTRFGGRLSRLQSGVGFLPRVSDQPVYLRQP